MKKKLLIFILFLITISSIKAQEKLDSLNITNNPIVFADVSFGYTIGSLRGLTGVFSLNYQKKNNLFTFRHLEIVKFDDIDFFFIIPVDVESRRIREYSMLYGKRIIKEGTSYHFSGGFSYNTYQQRKNNNIIASESFVGFPLEFGVSWFKSKKERFRILYGLLPVGKPTSFGRAFGIKLHANLAKRSYVGIGLTFGLGWHKIHKNEI
ncbi:hypothetical protein [uncultured Polaribacter sp.]|uniref:hypothetical protein n=1 Tax=uncultured Polaribacter sp. TaxID=174711 RepID=UPI00260691D3|nr:hypothetical protein [uncultured Polaribacter sp.]